MHVCLRAHAEVQEFLVHSVLSRLALHISYVFIV